MDGYGALMSEKPDQHRVDERATDLLPEEIAAGSDDAQTQARILLEDSDERTDDGEYSEHPDDADPS